MTSPVTPDLPEPIRAYLVAHAEGDVDTAIRSFSPAAVVTDEGRTFVGTEQVQEFLRHAGSEYSYTTRLVSVEHILDEDADADRWVVVNRLEGDFPGGVAEPAFRFTLVDGLVVKLFIG